MGRIGKNRIVWTDEMLAYLREHYPSQTNGDIADHLGCSDRTVATKAAELGLKKAGGYSNKYLRRYTKNYKNGPIYERSSN